MGMLLSLFFLFFIVFPHSIPHVIFSIFNSGFSCIFHCFLHFFLKIVNIVISQYFQAYICDRLQVNPAQRGTRKRREKIDLILKND